MRAAQRGARSNAGASSTSALARSGRMAAQVAAANPPREDPKTIAGSSSPASPSIRVSIRETVRSKNDGSLKSGIASSTPRSCRRSLAKRPLLELGPLANPCTQRKRIGLFYPVPAQSCARSRAGHAPLQALAPARLRAHCHAGRRLRQRLSQAGGSDLQLSAGRRLEVGVPSPGQAAGEGFFDSERSRATLPGEAGRQRMHLRQADHAGGKTGVRTRLHLRSAEATSCHALAAV